MLFTIYLSLTVIATKLFVSKWLYVIDNLTLSFYHVYFCITGIAADVTDSALQSLLQTLPGMGGMSVSRSGLCHSYVWTADWLQVGGDRPPITLNTRNIQVYTSPEIQCTTAV